MIGDIFKAFTAILRNPKVDTSHLDAQRASLVKREKAQDKLDQKQRTERSLREQSKRRLRSGASGKRYFDSLNNSNNDGNQL